MTDDVIKSFGRNESGQELWVFHCPGCNYAHPYKIPGWNWNGSTTKPTFTPSLLVAPDSPPNRCHLFVTDGMIQFCSDCHHSLAGQTVPMIPVKEWFE